MDLERRSLTYTGGLLDRAGADRADPARMAAMLTPDARMVPMWRDRCFVAGEPLRPVAWSQAELPGDVQEAQEPVFLGLDGTRPVFAIDLSGLSEEDAVAATGADRTADVRAIVSGLSAAEAAVQAYARGMLHWHRHQVFCGACGQPTESRHGGHARLCRGPDCGRLHFPRIEPAVIVLIEAPGDPARCLLARHRGAAEDGYALIAGFVEVGESLEDAVRREVSEEAGVELSSVRYLASQAWPFPAGLMVGFHAMATGDEFRVDGAELVAARWFTRAELRERITAGRRLGRDDAIDRLLFETWLADVNASPTARVAGSPL
ncbi:NAD(+) diphosphatase [Plantactinospora sp. GCM10030261]|uniref:NAD(+) diphosphatase n=1 Tax=Plantactinospora sp. GCM10030261 TaxID=3273420 RepID=UPI00360F29E8